MSLDLNKTATQIHHMAQELKARHQKDQHRLEQAVEVLLSADASVIEKRRTDNDARIAWNIPSLRGDIASQYQPLPTPTDFCVMAVDGSHIDVDRHIPARCYLINVGACILTYGSSPNATLLSQPRLYANSQELIIAEEGTPMHQQPVEGVLLGAKRAVEEMKALAGLALRAPSDVPTLALVDGSLIMLALIGQGYPDYVRHILVRNGFVTALEQLQQAAQARPLAVAGYISLPRSFEVASALRLQVCPYPTVDCQTHCGKTPLASRPCDVMEGIIDRDLFGRVLAPGQRSALFGSTSHLVKQYYGPHQILFFYLNTGHEMARVEVPAWVAQDPESLDLTHSLVLDQCRLGMGYPVALMEAHEQAVITQGDRERFQELVESALSERRLPVYSSQKSVSKRLRWL